MARRRKPWAERIEAAEKRGRFTAYEAQLAGELVELRYRRAVGRTVLLDSAGHVEGCEGSRRRLGGELRVRRWRQQHPGGEAHLRRDQGAPAR